MGGNIRFALSYQTFEPVDDLIVAITLRSSRTGGIVTTVTHPVSKEILPAGHAGSIKIEFPEIKLRPGEYPIYITLRNNREIYFDVIDDLTIPLIISARKDNEELGFDPTRDQGVFSIESRLIK